MCGFAGFLGAEAPDQPEAVLRAMADALRHRGPDDAGVWFDGQAGVGLAHRRLAIVDLTPAGHQPMRSPCGRFVLAYNGEIYNHLDLRAALAAEGGAFAWRGHSDTETLLAALRHWGVEGALQRVNGMFAFALWDAQERTLVLVRDRMGEKPLYYGTCGGAFLFGSELKALRAHPAWRGEIDRDALAAFLRFSYVPTPYSIFRGVHKLPPAHFVVVRDGGRAVGEPRCYWDLARVAEEGVRTARGDAQELEEELDALLRDAVARRMMSDVPLGAFLSGGYDSTTVAALMQAQSGQPVRTFSIGFHEETFDEAKHAKAVARHLGTEHTELYVTPAEALAVIPKLPEIYDEPFADSSQIPTYLVSALARRHVTVALSGDGGDELFCGYNRYTLGYRVWRVLRWLPFPLRRAAAAMLRRLPGQALDALQRRFVPQRLRLPALADRLPKLAEVLEHRDGAAFYRSLVSHWKKPDDVVLGAREPVTVLDEAGRRPRLRGLREEMMWLDQMSYLPDDILTKVDRASMAVSLEARVPLLDHRLVEFAWRVPMALKYRDGQNKWLLRQVVYRYVPRELMERPKMGFGVPIEEWLRGPLREWAEELLAEKRLREEGFFDPVPIRRMWAEHLSGARRWHYYLWDVLMFQAWLARWRRE